MNSLPPGRSSLNASRLMSLYPRAARSACAAVAANRGGSRTMTSKLAARSRSLRSSANASPSSHSQAASGSALRRDVCPRQLERLGRAVEREDGCGAAHQRRDGEPPGVGKGIQHRLAVQPPPQAGAVLALVEVETGLLPAAHIDQVGDSVLLNLDPRRRLHARQHSGALRQPFQLADADVGPLVDSVDLTREPTARPRPPGASTPRRRRAVERRGSRHTGRRSRPGGHPNSACTSR